jgi:hypothetical protein
MECFDQFTAGEWELTHTRTFGKSRLTTRWLAQYRITVRAEYDGLCVREDGCNGKAAYIAESHARQR